MEAQGTEVLCHLVGLVVVDVRPATQREEQRKEQMTARNQIVEAVHRVSLRKPKHGDGQ